MNLPWDWQVVQSKASDDSWPSCCENQYHCLYKTMFKIKIMLLCIDEIIIWKNFPPSCFKMISFFLCVLPRMSNRTVIYRVVIYFNFGKNDPIHFYCKILEYFENNSHHVHLRILENNSNHFHLRIFEYFGK